MNKQLPLLTFIIVLTNIFVNAQDYQMILTDRNQYFYATEVDEFFEGETIYPQLLGIRVDSVKTEEGNEVYYFQKYLRYDSDNAPYVCPGPSWMGPKVVHRPDGATIFFNKNNDSIFFYPAKGNNESWVMYKFADGSYLEATITNIEIVLFDYDLVNALKYITLQAKDKDNNPIDHPFNGKQFILSKDYGLVQTFNLYHFPEKNKELNSYYLVSAEPHNPGECYISYQDNVTPQDFFDYNVGDEFHYYGEWRAGVMNFGYEKSKQKILTRKLSSNQDTITYTYSIEEYKMTSNYDLNTNQSIVEEDYNEDTLEVKYVFSELTYLEKLPFEPIYDTAREEGYGYGYTQSIFRNDTLVKKSKFNFSFENDCFVLHLDMSGYDELVSGLGYYYSYSNDGYFETTYELVYHKSGSEEWGSQLVLDKKELSTHTIGFSVYPVPASNQLTIELTDKRINNVEINLISALGEKILSTTSSSQSPVQLLLPELQKGLYLLEVKATDGNAVSRKAIVIE